MNEFSPPTPTHLVVFSALLLGGMLDLISYDFIYHPEHFSVTTFLSNSVSILLLSAGWSIPFAEGIMFVERVLEERRERFMEEAFKISEINIAKILESRNLTKNDLPKLRRILSTGEDS